MVALYSLATTIVQVPVQGPLNVNLEQDRVISL